MKITCASGAFRWLTKLPRKETFHSDRILMFIPKDKQISAFVEGVRWAYDLLCEEAECEMKNENTRSK